MIVIFNYTFTTIAIEIWFSLTTQIQRQIAKICSVFWLSETGNLKDKKRAFHMYHTSPHHRRCPSPLLCLMFRITPRAPLWRELVNIISESSVRRQNRPCASFPGRLETRRRAFAERLWSSSRALASAWVCKYYAGCCSEEHVCESFPWIVAKG